MPIALKVILCAIVALILIMFILSKMHLDGNYAERCWIKGDCSYEHESKFFKKQRKWMDGYNYNITEKGYVGRKHYIKLEFDNGKYAYFFCVPSKYDVSTRYGFWLEKDGKEYSYASDITYELGLGWSDGDESELDEN